MNIKNNLIITLLCLLFTNLYLLKSEQKQIRLLDLETALPIVQSTFVYGEQTGISDENGIISFLP